MSSSFYFDPIDLKISAKFLLRTQSYNGSVSKVTAYECIRNFIYAKTAQDMERDLGLLREPGMTVGEPLRS
jgi:hypothetical protein